MLKHERITSVLSKIAYREGYPSHTKDLRADSSHLQTGPEVALSHPRYPQTLPKQMLPDLEKSVSRSLSLNDGKVLLKTCLT